MKKEQAKKLTIKLRNEGFSIYYICKETGKSQASIYRYLQEDYDEKYFPILKDSLKDAISKNNLQEFLDSLSYRELCCLSRNYHQWGQDKRSRKVALLRYFKHFNNLGLYPDGPFTKDDIKRAFRKRAKQVHPDLNKSLNKNGAEFQEVYNSYTYLLTCSF